MIHHNTPVIRALIPHYLRATTPNVGRGTSQNHDIVRKTRKLCALSSLLLTLHAGTAAAHPLGARPARFDILATLTKAEVIVSLDAHIPLGAHLGSDEATLRELSRALVIATDLGEQPKTLGTVRVSSIEDHAERRFRVTWTAPLHPDVRSLRLSNGMLPEHHHMYRTRAQISAPWRLDAWTLGHTDAQRMTTTDWTRSESARTLTLALSPRAPLEQYLWPVHPLGTAEALVQPMGTAWRVRQPHLWIALVTSISAGLGSFWAGWPSLIVLAGLGAAPLSAGAQVGGLLAAGTMRAFGPRLAGLLLTTVSLLGVPPSVRPTVLVGIAGGLVLGHLARRATTGPSVASSR